MDSVNQAVVILFRGDPRRDERQKRLPPRFLSTLHAAILKTMREVAGVDVLIAREVGDEFRLGSGRWQLDTLAERIDAAIAYGFTRGYTRVLLLAGDIIGLRRSDILRALHALDGSLQRAAIGFSSDGGFYVAGFSQSPEVDWTRLLYDRPNAGAALTAALRGDGFHVEELPPVDDVDSRADAERLVRLRRNSRAFLRLTDKLTAILQRVIAFAALPLLPRDPALAFSSTFRGPPRRPGPR